MQNLRRRVVSSRETAGRRQVRDDDVVTGERHGELQLLDGSVEFAAAEIDGTHVPRP